MSDPTQRREALRARLLGRDGAGWPTPPVRADGSTGTALEALAPGSAARAILLPLEEPGLVEGLHRAYFEAGADLVETATFQASASGLGPEAAAGVVLDGRPCHDPEEIAYRVNLEAARAARRAADAAEADAGEGACRFVAGSMGPGDKPPSLGAATYGDLLAAYLPQARGLVDGGCDLAFVETCQDPLQIKAALAALAHPRGGRGLPAVVSATVDARGLLLAGTDLAALVAIVAPFRPLALGLNCSGGPEELEGPLASLAALSPLPLSFLPNAGLPFDEDGTTTWPLGPEAFGPLVAGIAARHGVALVGGCCGTGPDHIRSLSRALGPGYAIPPRPVGSPALASLYAAAPLGPGLFRIGERANAAGSAAFAALVSAGDLDGAAAKAVAQEATGAQALDLHVAKPGRDEAADLSALTARLAGLSRAALCLDSSDPEVLARALPLVGGRPLLNSTSLESPDKARRVFGLARDFGAAVVCLAMDSNGPAPTAEAKAAICRSLYEIALGEFGLSPDALLFDPLTFTVAAGPAGAARETLRAIGLIKAACPGALTVLGVGNISYGLPKAVRPAVTATFLGAARESGLDAAIMDTGGIPDPASVAPPLREAALALIEGRSREGYDPLALLLEAGGAVRTALPPEAEDADPQARLRAAVLAGDRGRSGSAARLVAAAGGPSLLGEAIGAAMAEAGAAWSAGTLPLPLVLRAAEAARAALAVVEETAAGAAKGTVVTATVKGDLHDIGKNIAGAILACSGYRVVDLGIDVAAADIVAAARREAALAVGLSGLLTRSLGEMRTACEALEADGSRALVLAGGAALDAGFAARNLEPAHPGLVEACADAFQGLSHLEAHREGRRSGPLAAGRREGGRPGPAATPAPPIAAAPGPLFRPPFTGSRLVELAAEEVFAALDEATLFHARWGYRRSAEDAGAGFAAARAELDRLRALVLDRGLLRARAVVGFLPCRTEGGNCLVVAPAGAGEVAQRFVFPREDGAGGRSVADYFFPAGDHLPAFAVTVGRPLAEAARARKDSGDLGEYWRLHGLASALAEAAAELAHDHLGGLLAAGGGHRGQRYSFGYPACPGVESQAALLGLLRATEAGIGVTEGCQLDPEHSVSAIVVPREDAVYFSSSLR